MLTYCIVEFIEENCIEIIPSSWLSSDNETAFWPKGVTPSILKKHLKLCTEPQTSWSSVNIRLLGQAENLVDAEKKAQKAQDTSQLSSDSEYDNNIPLTRRKKLPYRFRDSSDEEIAERLPRKQHENVGSPNKRPIVPPLPELQDCKKKAVTENVQSSPSISTISHTTKDITPRSEVASNEKETNFTPNIKGILIKIFKLIEDVRFEVLELRKEQQEIKVQLNNVLTANNTGHINKFCKMLPMSRMESFDEIENCLVINENDYVSLVQYLSLANGETVQTLVPSIMKLLMKKCVAMQFSGCGRRNKRDFSATKIAAAVYEIVLHKLPNSSKDAVSKKISKFLAESADREGGRKQRFKVTE